MDPESLRVERRTLLTAGAVGLGITALQGSLSRAFAQALQAPAGDTPLDRAVRLARSRGKPVLVLVAPEHLAERCALVEFLGDLYWLAWDEVRYPLALVEVACATRKQLAAYCGEVGDVLGVLELEDVGPRWTRIDAEVESWVETLDARRDRARKSFLSVLIGDLATAERRARACARALGAQRTAEVERSLAEGASEHGSPAVDLVDDAAALFHLADRRAPSNRRRWTFALVRAANARVWALAPFGARWCFQEGAQERVHFLPRDDGRTRAALTERARELAPAPPPGRDACSAGPCGTGTSGPVSARFLVFYTDDRG
jgi:hypothetical protein